MLPCWFRSWIAAIGGTTAYGLGGTIAGMMTASGSSHRKQGPGLSHGRVSVSASLIMTFLMTTGTISCEQSAPSGLNGQGNASMTFYGIAVDQHGEPLRGARFEFIVEAIPKDWTFETRGKPHVRATISAVSDTDGRFRFDIVAHSLFLQSASLDGFRHLSAELGEESNLGIGITSWSDLLYRSDPVNPTVYVFVKDGVKEVSVLPSRGGSRAFGKQWIANKPVWPKRPSLHDVVYQPPATQASSQPATRP